ncbi:unnamed protein product [Macrosiphum euphorbiae]|nr:unnamed protein product [Macrosiphum euphorbiae]
MVCEIHEKNAKQCVDDGNILLKQQNISGGINKYNEAIKERPYYAIPHYNRRIALSNNLLVNNSQDINLASRVDPYFVVNIIAAVPERRFSDDSSDEEPDEEFNAMYDELENNNVWPFTTRPQKTIKIKTESKILDLEPNSYKNQDTADSMVVDPLLSKVLANGFEVHDENKLRTIAVSIGLNRMRSLSTRKNDSLRLELKSQVNTREINYKQFGFYWKCPWYTKIGTKAEFKDVKKFYKCLKTKNSDLANKFIAQEENKGAECNIPYRDIREHAKNHSKTKELIKTFRDDNNTAMIYLHLVDSDVLDFNGVYSAYLRIIAGCYKPPIVMSTGYEFPEDTQNKAYCLLGHMERMHRVITTFHIPLGTYYPEPNMCILIPQNCETVEESFISPKRGNTHESPILIENILKRRPNSYAIFSEDNPIIINLPSRFKVCKRKKLTIKFSEFNTGSVAPTFDDIKKYDDVSQSHTDNLPWTRSLFINKSIKCDNGYETDGESISSKKNTPLTVYNECVHLIGKIRNNLDVELSQTKLANRIGKDNSNNIVNAINDIKEFQKYFNIKYERTPEEQELIDTLKEYKICYDDLSRKYLLMMVQIMRLIKNKINIECLFGMDEEATEYIFENNEIIQALNDKEMDPSDLIDICRDDFDDFMSACDDHSCDPREVVKLYQENPLHLQFLNNDPYNVTYENSDDADFVHFAVDNEYLDEEDLMNISENLLQGREDSAANMEFQGILMEREHEKEMVEEEMILNRMDEEEMDEEEMDEEEMI